VNDLLGAGYLQTEKLIGIVCAADGRAISDSFQAGRLVSTRSTRFRPSGA
jgi:hypothetical protein